MTGKLIICSNSPIPDNHRLTDHLVAIGLICADDRSHRGDHYHPAGEHFLQLITFLGCSPFIRFTPDNEEDDGFTHIRLPPGSHDVRFRYSHNLSTPRCPHCKERQPEWINQLQENMTSKGLHCRHCNTPSQPMQVNWRQMAGAGRSFIEVWGVFPGEAVPTAELLQQLQQHTGASWDYFYLQE